MQILKAMLLLLAVVLLAACGGDEAADTGPTSEVAEVPAGMMGPGRMGMEPGGGMMARHHATIPDAYAGLESPVPASEDSIARGAALYASHCTVCHGESGLGDGPTADSYDPAPSPIAHTSQMLGDAYLFWRVSEGGSMAPFNSAMPAWKSVLDEQARWDVINYVRALGQGVVGPGQAWSPELEASMRAEMLQDALARDVVTEEEAALFDEVHGAMDQLRATGAAPGGDMNAREEALLQQLVEEGTITEDKAAQYRDVHERLQGATSEP